MDHPAVGKEETPGNGNYYSIGVPKTEALTRLLWMDPQVSPPAPTPPHTHK